MLNRIAAFFVLFFIAIAAMADTKAIPHDFLVSLQPEASESTYNQVIEALEKQGATSKSFLLPIMQERLSDSL